MCQRTKTPGQARRGAAKQAACLWTTPLSFWISRHDELLPCRLDYSPRTLSGSASFLAPLLLPEWASSWT